MDPLFASDTVLHLVMDTEVAQLVGDPHARAPSWIPMTLRYEDASGHTVSVRGEVRTAGRSRAARCRTPPLHWRLDADDARGSLFEHHDLIRVTTHCQDKGEFENYVIEEYLIYRILNLLSPWSYRARLLQLDYGGGNTHFAFVTEHETMLAARTGWHPLEIERNLTRSEVEPNQTALLSVFAYLIGNTDYSPIAGPKNSRCCHNIQLIGEPDGPYIPVPYDFDSAGIISAPYAAPGESLPITEVRQRYFWGYCEHRDYLPAILQRFVQAKPELYALYEEQVGLDDRRKRKAIAYFDEFYRTIEREGRRRSQIVEACR
ncbi:MAG: hypothetical protein ACFB9M_04375 [Myxococcota bacterium]